MKFKKLLNLKVDFLCVDGVWELLPGIFPEAAEGEYMFYRRGVSLWKIYFHGRNVAAKDTFLCQWTPPEMGYCPYTSRDNYPFTAAVFWID